MLTSHHCSPHMKEHQTSYRVNFLSQKRGCDIRAPKLWLSCFFLSLSLSLPQTVAESQLKELWEAGDVQTGATEISSLCLTGGRRGGGFKDQLDWEMGVTNLSKMGWWTWCWQPATMAGDFTQEQSLTRHCQKTCHLRQTRPLTRMGCSWGWTLINSPNCQQDMALIVAFSEVKLKKKWKIKTQVQFVWSCLDILSTLCLHHKPAASQDTEMRQSVRQVLNYSVQMMVFKLLL